MKTNKKLGKEKEKYFCPVCEEWYSVRGQGGYIVDVFGPFFSSGQCAYPLCQPETMITPTRFNTLPS